MATRERPVDRGRAKALRALATIGAEIRLARRSAGLSLATVARQVRLSASELSRIERARVVGVSLLKLGELSAVVGLDLAARAYQGGSALRDARHAALLERLPALLHEALSWALEVPLPRVGDQRAWDALIRGDGWRFGVECELNPLDGQALLRRLNLKQADGLVDGVILLMRDTRQSRQFRREFKKELARRFPIPASVALSLLGQGKSPGGNSLVVL